MNKLRICTFLSSLFLLAGVSGANTVGELILAENGKATSVIVTPESIHPLQQIAIDDFVVAIQKASGATLPVVSEKSAPPASAKTTRLILGPSELTKKLGYPGDDLKLDDYRIHTVNNDLVILAKDLTNNDKVNNIWGNKPSEDTRMSQWALGHLLDRYVGVRWLWPGELGTYIPRKETIAIPHLDVRFRQPLVDREFNVIEDNPDNLRWLGYHHFGGHRENYVTAHSFNKNRANGNWWEEFLETRPDMLAQSPNGKPEQMGKINFFKICISNPDSADEIIRRWEAAGAPDFWDVSPNDGNGFCTCENCRALDKKYGHVEYTKDEIWNRPDHVSLTERYVWFWNQLLRRMQAINPNAKIGVFLYGAFREPPEFQKLTPGVFGFMVRDFNFDSWKAWTDAGVSEIGLRPNWLYMGASGPHLPFKDLGSYIEQARLHNMAVIKMDCFHEYWATQGPTYYLIGRLISRWDLNADDIIKEYCSAFEEAGPAIRSYLKFWEDYHNEVVYNIPAGGSMRVDPNGIYGRESVKHFGQIMHPLRGHWKTLPYVYNEAVMNRARDILETADQKATNEQTHKRIDFLRDGLRMVDLASAYMLAQKDKNGRAMKTGLKNLVEFGEAMKEKHGYWHGKDVFFLKYWGLIGEEYEMSSGQ